MDRREAKRRERWGRKRPLCYPELSVSVCMSVLTQSRSICHQDCRCGTKREGSLPGRTHSERNGERQDRHKEAGWSLGRSVGGVGKSTSPHLRLRLQKHTCRDQEDWTSNSLINTFNPDMFCWLDAIARIKQVLANVLFAAEKSTKAQKLLLMRKSSHLLSWRDVVLD